MAIESKAISELVSAITSDNEGKKSNTYSAIISRVDSEGVIWVRVAGSEKETPTASTSAEVKANDKVNVEWRNNKLYIAGNVSDPSAGSIRVAAAEQAAQIANQAAQNAVTDAGIARQAAEDAQATADSVHGIAVQAQEDAGVASKSANQALNGLSIVEDVVDTLTWLSEHASFDLSSDTYFIVNKQYYMADEDYFKTGDTQIDLTKTYYERTGEGTEESPYVYVQVQSPDIDDIDNYYEYGITGYSYFPITTDYSKTSDRSVEAGKTYYTRSGEGTGDDPYVYTSVANPVNEDLDKYYEYNGSPVSLGLYELTDISDAVTNYIDTHLALMKQGLWISGSTEDEDNADYKILIASGNNPGVYIYGPGGVISRYGTDIEFSSELAQKIGGENSYIQFVPAIGNVPEHINIVADSVQIGARDITTAFDNTESRLDNAETVLEH